MMDYNFHIMKRLIPLCWIAVLCAQTSGIISGTVVDSDSQAIVNAQVQATNTSTKTVYKTTASDSGRYTLATLPPGAYDVSITAAGFYPHNQANVPVGATEPLRLDVRLLE